MKVTIPISKKEYEIVDTMLRSEVREAQRLMRPFIGLVERVGQATPEQMDAIVKDIENKEPAVDTFIFKIISHCIPTITQEYFENDMRNIESLLLFNEIYHASTALPAEFLKEKGAN